jgi:hypothetical protein
VRWLCDAHWDEEASLAGGGSFEEFYATAYRRIVGQVFALLGDLHEAEDVTQDAFAKASFHWSRIAPDPGELWLLDTTTGQARQVPMPPPQILQPIALHWPAGSGKIVIALYSNPGRSNTQARVLYVDPATGAQSSLVLSRGREAGLYYLDVDASGHYLIYVLAGRSGTMTIWWYGEGKSVRLTPAYNQAGSTSGNEPGW